MKTKNNELKAENTKYNRIFEIKTRNLLTSNITSKLSNMLNRLPDKTTLQIIQLKHKNDDSIRTYIMCSCKDLNSIRLATMYIKNISIVTRVLDRRFINKIFVMNKAKG